MALATLQCCNEAIDWAVEQGTKRAESASGVINIYTNYKGHRTIQTCAPCSVELFFCGEKIILEYKIRCFVRGLQRFEPNFWTLLERHNVIVLFFYVTMTIIHKYCPPIKPKASTFHHILFWEGGSGMVRLPMGGPTSRTFKAFKDLDSRIFKLHIIGRGSKPKVLWCYIGAIYI